MSYPTARFELTMAESARLDAIGAAFTAAAAELVERYKRSFDCCKVGNANLNMFDQYLGQYGYATKLRAEITVLLNEFDHTIAKPRARARRILSARIRSKRTAR